METDMLNKQEIIGKYKDITSKLLKMQLPNLSPEEINNGIDYSIKKKIYNGNCSIYNNYKEKTVNTSMLNLIQYILKKQPILTAYGVMFKKHADAPNPIIDLIDILLNNRTKHKDMMFTFPKGSEDFEKYNLLQLLDKIDCNGLYGAMGNVNCILYNLHVAPSITTQARSCTSSAGLLFEMFLANGCKFSSFNEMITFVNNVVNEKKERKYDDYALGIRNISINDCFAKLIGTCGFDYIPTEHQAQILLDLLYKLSQEDINRIYYKNNLYEFMNNKSMQKMLIWMLKKLKKPFMDPNHPPKEILTELNLFQGILMEYVYYHYHIIDRLDKYNYMVRSVSIITDTDSTIISVDAWFRYVLNLVKDEDLDIKHELIDVVKYLKKDEFGDIINEEPVITRVDDEYDYNFYDDEMIKLKKTINPLVVIPQEGVRYSIINILSYILGNLVNDYMERYTKNTNSYSKDRKCLIFMKNEFLFKRVLLNLVKKNYATIQELQEGHVVEESARMDVKGLQLTKSGTNMETQNRLKKILYEDILTSGDSIDFVKIIKDLAIFEKEMIEEIKSGSKKLFKPAKIKNIDTYVDPMRTPGVKECIVWNEVKDDGVEGLNLHEQNFVDLIKVQITPDNLEKMKDKFPNTYSKFKNLMNTKDKFSELISGVALPKNIDVPEWILDYIDYTSILNDNLHLFPLKPLKVYRGNNNKNNNYTNIISL